MKPAEIQAWLDENQWKFDRPEAYLGDEPNSLHRDWDKAPLRVCFAGAGTYEGLTGNLGVPIMVGALGAAKPDCVVERAFFVNSDKEWKLFNEGGIPIFAIESKHQLKDFDVVGFSTSYQLVDVNVVQMLLSNGMNPRAEKRLETDPIILRGGANFSNPAPWADMYDVCFIGEGEEAIVEMMEVIQAGKDNGLKKLEILEVMAKLPGVFVPRFYKEVWEQGVLKGWEVSNGAPKTIHRVFIKDLNKAFMYDHPIMNYVRAMGSGELLISRGCFHYSTPVKVGNNEEMQIGDIVENKRKVSVLSWNAGEEKFEYRKVVDWHDNGMGKFIRLFLRGDNRTIACTDDHEIMTPIGYRKAGELKVGDEVLSQSGELTSAMKSILLGSVLGDGSVEINKGVGAHRFRIQQAVDKTQHREVVSRILKPYISYEGVWKRGKEDSTRKDQYCIAVSGTDEINNLAEQVTESGKKKVKREWVDQIDEMALAVWYMHDGNLAASDCVRMATNALDEEELSLLQDVLMEKWGIDFKKTPAAPGSVLWGRKYESAKFLWLVAPYVLEEFDYKLPEWAKRIKKFYWRECELKPHSVSSIAKILKVELKPFSGRNQRRYDLEIEGNHNYVVQNVVVHNCQARCSFCLTAGVTLQTKTGLVPIEKIKVGDEVRSKDGWSVVRDWFVVGAKEAIKVEFDQEGIELSGGIDHPVEMEDGTWVELRNLKVGDEVQKYGGVGSTRVKSVSMIGVQQLYEITLDAPHQYYANFISSHNCNEGAVCKPYRELSVDNVIKALTSSMKESGSPGVVCSAFCSSSHSQKKNVMYRLLTEVTDHVDLLSQRCDEFAEDRDFALLTGMGGNRSVSLGVEGPSERARRNCDKHAHEEHILKATRWAIEAGYKKIKYFMISSMPTVTDQDNLELIDLATKIKTILDEYPERKKHIHMRFNWTELRNADHTAYQWAKPTIGARELRPILKPLTELGFRVGFGSHKSTVVDLFSQLSFLGDRRLFEPFIQMIEEKGLIYLRGFKVDMLQWLPEYMGRYGLKLEDYLRERTYEEILPWDLIDVGVTKESLWKQWQADKNDTSEWPKCSQSCSSCGACDKEDLQTRKQVLSNDDSLPVPLDQMKIIRKRGTMGHLRMKVIYDQQHRYVTKQAKMSLIRRACYKLGIPISMLQIRMASNLIKTDDWIAGADYIDVPIFDFYTKTVEEIKDGLNENLIPFGVEVVEVWMLSAKAGQLNMMFDLCYYSMDLPAGKQEEIVERIKWFKAQEIVTEALPQDGTGVERAAFLKKYPTVIRIAIKGFRGIERILVDSRALVDDVWVVKEGDKYRLKLLARGMLSSYHFIGVLLPGEKFKRVPRLKAERVEYFVHREEEQIDFERGECEVCGKKVDTNLFNELFADGVHCPRHKDVQDGSYYGG